MIEEENEDQAPDVTHEIPIDPISAKLVDAEEEEKRLQEKINEAVQRERQQAVVAEVAPRFCTRKMQLVCDWCNLVGSGRHHNCIDLDAPTRQPSNCGKDGYFGPKCNLYFPNCSVASSRI